MFFRNIATHIPDHCYGNLKSLNPLNAELNPVFHLLVLLEAHHILHVSRLRVKDWLGGGEVEGGRR